ncbi:prolyl 4-hydroxylase subunit alpha-1 [Chelonus insularis]|uniref:prolyl 4-hydroxylase subunit alpha-1 n=1 Tax=Chelonus insularis TaxID=460826 RepID=UPI00158E7412|nr:prolyl 4-hydroxylase subunit alpha-1 [Chelonus insularis]XP_034938308.1 prolyl 4-hydroxylase subunit alpha-1 [Chelonus insularis]XP_034938309.1 prolyl 4-hydroxylase subunit alpha-1 [Chelonus insularis]XP_034938310.1 prolyl 4-hydroxylase subunit alpha-1 [Chelonus insularis]XP_034938312.1 prolyl 4-hydroxylase subunit alpha-1 [Chelonus insularis]XP_034938313.1 prolyl 4-hydroxylase subunit alpha-1 [Chelonus insularis]
MASFLKLVSVILVIYSFLSTGNGELYTALADMEELLETESVLIDTLHGYIKAQEQRLDTLRRNVEDYSREHEEASRNIQQYLSNPINAYLLVKRLTTDWKRVEELITEDVGKAFVANITNSRSDLKFPTDEDLNGAAVALIRLQDTYKLDTSHVARGVLNGVQYSTGLSAGDCFELGRQSYNNGDYYHTVLWMQEAMNRLQEEQNRTTTNKPDILEYLAFSTYMQGNVARALSMTNELLELVPSHQRALGNRAYYQEEIQKNLDKKSRGEDGKSDVPLTSQFTVVEKKVKTIEEMTERERYEMLCRGEVPLSPRIQKNLKCRYVDRGIPFLKIAPFKEEEAYLDPRIVIYHDVIYDEEIDTIKKLAQPRFKRATVQNYKTGELEIANYRISKSAWLQEYEHKHVQAVSRRVEHMTSLTVDTAEELQVVNYGIGGHYEPHFDFARREETNAFKSLGTGNRIATVLYYMSDVEQGGGTVFTAINISLWPKKGSAAVWYNLKPNGEGDYKTRHAACPVLTGSKWVANKWLHERGQEFLRPCTLENQPPDDDVGRY